MTKLTKRSKVEWTWGAHRAKGRVAARFTDDVTRTIKGKRIKRQASEDKPAFLIEQDDGGCVLKSASELKAAER